MKAIVLAGGKSTRMHADKALLKVNRLTLIELISFQLSEIFKEVVVITNNQLKASIAELFISFDNINVYEDLVPDKGPVGGLYTAFNVIDDEAFFLTSCDSAYFDKNTINGMMQFVSDYDAVSLGSDERFEPMFAFYSRKIEGKVEENLENDKLSMQKLLSEINTRKIQVIDDNMSQRLTLNINTEEQFTAIKPKLLKLEKEIMLKERQR